MAFIKFFLRWVASNLAIPFWVVGHIHLTMNVYKDIYEILASLSMNIVVAIGFWLDWKETKEQKTHHNHKS
jgi:ABC-type nickel/cobalt efflux system permease component RcnA